jgi:hypothetical protein
MHSQWIFQNIALHDRKHGYLHKKKANKIMKEISALLDLAPEKVPKASRFLLKNNF